MRINTETYNWTKFREWETLGYSILNGYLHQINPLKAQGFMENRRQKYCKSHWWWMTPRPHQDLWCTNELTETAAAQDQQRFQPDRDPALRWGSRQGLPPQPRSYLQLIWAKGRSVFSDDASLGIPTFKTGLMPRKSWPTQNRLHVLLYAFYILCFGLVFLYLLCLFCQIGCF